MTRDPFHNRGRLTHLIESGKLFADLGLPPLDPARDRVMICGSPGLLKDTCALLNARGFTVSPHIGEPGDYVIERAFAEQLEHTKDDVQLIEEINADEGVSWLFSFLSADRRRSYCLYEAQSPDAIIAAARRAGVPADEIVEVDRLDPAAMLAS